MTIRTVAPIFGVLSWAALSQAQTNQVDTEGWEFKDTPSAVEASEAALPEVIDEPPKSATIPGYQRQIGLGLSPHLPLAPASLPGTLQPAFGSPNFGRSLGYEFHGYMQVPLRASFGTRDKAWAGQHDLVIHGDPVVPGANYGWFEHTMTVPTPWAHLAFTVGNRTVKATTQVGAWSMTESDEAAGYFRAPSKVWFNSAFLTYSPQVEPVVLRITAGAYPERYGGMGRWTQGAYASAIIGSVSGVGATATVELPFEGDWTAKLEGGMKGDFDRVPVGMYPSGSNEWARAWYGSTYATHGHFGINYLNFEPTFHYIRAFSQDDRSDAYDDSETEVDERLAPEDGSLQILGGDLRWDGKRFGYLYLGASHVRGINTNRLSNLVQVINSGDGAVLMERFWGFASQGNGRLSLAGGQYTVSLGTWLRHPYEFWGEGPDLTLSVFGLYGKNNSRVDAFDREMLKYGVEGVYSVFSWFAPSLRLDQVHEKLSDSGRNWLVISPKLVFRSDWTSRESLTLQYAGYVTGKDVLVHGDGRLMTSASRPDKHLVTLYGTLWW